MAKVYADLIRKGKKTLDDVPEKLKAQVKDVLESLECPELAE
jgi:hypothetical protein